MKRFSSKKARLVIHLLSAMQPKQASCSSLPRRQCNNLTGVLIVEIPKKADQGHV
jgi:hypothetical protein